MSRPASFAGWVSIVAACLLSATPVQLRSQVRPANPVMTRALDAERRGAYADAAGLFGSILDERPTDGGALAGLERVLVPLSRLGELAPRLGRALDVDSTNVGLLGLAVRIFATIGRADSAERYAARWAAIEPGQDGPYREWAIAAIEGRDRLSAKRALDEGRRLISRPGALAPETAQLLQMEGDWAGSAREWIRAVDASPAYRTTAVLSLARAAPSQRAAVRTALASGSPEAPRVLALILARWGEFTEGTALMLRSLPSSSEVSVTLLRAMIDETRGREERAVLRARAELTEAVASYQAGPAAVRTRMDAARAFADAGDEKSARRLLAVVAADPDAPSGMATSASSTLLGVLLAEGKAAEAERVLTELSPTLNADERERQGRRVAMAHARNGNFARADSVIASDSSVAGFDLRGRMRLMQGDLAGATEYLKLAGPFDEEREHSVERVTLLALLQAVGKDSLAELGTAMMELERGDTAAAVGRLDTIARTLEPPGAAEARLLGGNLAFARGDTATAIRLLREADVAELPGTAAAARLAIARLEVARGNRDAAQAILEKLLLDFPESAVVPVARRLHDTIRGATPGSR